MLLTSIVALAGCAKDTGGGGGDNAAGQGCRLNPPPAAAPAPTTQNTQQQPAPNASNLRVGLAFDIGGRGDASFNDASVAGLDRARAEMGFTDVKELDAGAGEPEDAKQTRLRQLAREGYNPVIAVGYAYADALKIVAPEFPGTRFAIIDETIEGVPNVTSLVFAEEEGSFLAGVIAAHRSRNCQVGFVGGVQTPLIEKFEAGFVQGARTAAPDIKIERRYLTPAGDFSGFQDPNKGSEIATGQLEAGADVLYHAAGASGKGVFSAVKSADAMAIGVDSDQYNQPTVAEYRDVIISSMLKRVDLAVYDYIVAVARNDLSTLPKRFDLSIGGVDYSTSGGRINDLVPTLDAYKAAIARGEIKVSAKP
ncbi:BMP family ABC transporter substrate-binding protein [Saccharopolyspora subtropica]|uniref:BMP family ABC transporter substrate-binding protein n=1 Tax=Saccharopolyspora thermophila TaxID=89367 RepID=A0A917JPX9_9PSEU|nr:BMP family ABC transporter substrate-binding protein [Saccharopolyspora subtropica]GGI77802.1 BMP family ABC transporter substrate-binding protein [Saccharopolyspora subtropica]